MSMSKLMMEKRQVTVPKGITVTIDEKKTITVKGKKHTLERHFPYTSAQMKVEGDQFIVWDYFTKKKSKGVVGTIEGHLRNMIWGVTNGYTYKLKIIYSHFPITAKVVKQGKQNGVVITGQYGVREKRFIPTYDGCKVEVAGEDIVVSGPDIEAVSQSAARIQESTRLRGKHAKDSRVFQDGIYIYHKELRDKEQDE